jgi:ABC-2 type transport system permease protein
MKKILAVARWEYMEKVKSKIFLIGLLLTPLIMVAMGVLPTLFVNQEDEHSRIIGVIDPTGRIAAPFAERMQSRYTLKNHQPNYIVLPLAAGTGVNLAEAIADANLRVAGDQLDGYFALGPDGRDSIVEYRSKVVGDFQIPARIEENLKAIIAEERVASLGLDPSVLKKLAVKMDVRMVKMSSKGIKEEAGFEKVFLSAYVFLMMLFLLIVTSGQMLVRSVIEEKANRIVEVLVSSCSPTELMAGKVLGLSGLGLTQMAFWSLIGVAASLQFGMNLIDVSHALLLVVYFILGYLFYAAIFIAAGSPLNTEQEASQITSYLVLVLILPIVLAIPAMKDPNATWIKILTFIPFLTPTMMALRIPIQMPAMWEILLTVAIMVLAIYAAMVVAGRIFRIGILSTGKSPNLKEVFRWIKNG